MYFIALLLYKIWSILSSAIMWLINMYQKTYLSHYFLFNFIIYLFPQKIYWLFVHLYGIIVLIKPVCQFTPKLWIYCIYLQFERYAVNGTKGWNYVYNRDRARNMQSEKIKGNKRNMDSRLQHNSLHIKRRGIYKWEKAACRAGVYHSWGRKLLLLSGQRKPLDICMGES